ncbi:universal stress protein [Reichenbachiella carrageenanivorans]|uniref:Universal stress protein n=1 Tax=Reichenbachiella carrageenanivorans TaxID=2979869 RepID=A0ABY6CZT1_9BACT|nr:universal stress protein [Reichenbachiella carrageenanivorans]UXX79416.1 universal stress protein [Reichenbachiella carrageenanivorans]
MKDIKNFLVPVDFSEESTTGLKAANQLATKFKGQVHVVHFLPYHPVVTPIYSGSASTAMSSALQEQQMEDEKTTVLKKLRQEMDKHLSEDLKGQLYIVNDSLASGINELLRDVEVDLVVSGTSGESHLLQHFMGNNTEKLIRESGIPVLAISQYADIHFDDVMIATDLSTELPDRLYDICRMLENHGATIHFVNVNTTELLNEADILPKMTALVKLLKIRNYRIHVVPNKAEIAGIMQVVEDIKPGLILMKTYEKSSFWTFFQSSLSEKVIKETDIPVLVEKV